MQQLILNEKLILSLEPMGKSVRLILQQADEEVACRKETIKNLTHFLQQQENNIFKGRIQLHKVDDEIEIILKNRPIAKILAADFKQVLINLQ